MSQDHSTKEERLTGHEFDGIQEYDNPTPGWWHVIFWATLVYCFFYLAFFTGEFGWTPEQSHRRAEASYFEKLFGQLGELEPDEETILMLSTDEKWHTVGAGIFASNCAQCHGTTGGGLNGPNLTDEYYIHVNQLTDIYDTITTGVVTKGMPAWANRLNQNQRIVVAMYVASLRGTTPAGAIGPEPTAKQIAPWPAAPAPSPDS